MRYLIGIIFGILIVFNWSSVKSLFDASIGRQGHQLGQTMEPAGVNGNASPAPAVPAPTQNLDLSDNVEERLKAIAAGK